MGKFSSTGSSHQTGESAAVDPRYCPDTQWRPWCVNSGRGVLDHRSVLNALGTRSSISTATRCSASTWRRSRRAAVRDPGGPRCLRAERTTPDGQWLIYIHVPHGPTRASPARGGRGRLPLRHAPNNARWPRSTSAVFHVTPYDNQHFIVTHPAEHEGMMLTDFTSGKCVLLRDGDRASKVTWSTATQPRGIAYEVVKLQRGGSTIRSRAGDSSFASPRSSTISTQAAIPRADLLPKTRRPGTSSTPTISGPLCVWTASGDRWLRLTGNWPTYGGGQKAHFHPMITPDRRADPLTGGDPASQTLTCSCSTFPT